MLAGLAVWLPGGAQCSMERRAIERPEAAMHRPAILLTAVAAVALAASPVRAAKPAKPTPAKAAPVKPAPPAAAEPGERPAVPAPSALRADLALARLLAAIDKALAQPAPKDGGGPDAADALLDGIARSSIVALIHGHFAYAGLGQAMKTGAIPAAQVATMARTLAGNYNALASTFGALARQKAFAGGLDDIFRAVQALASQAETAGKALGAWAAQPDDAARAQAYDDAVETYRQRLEALFAHLEGGAKPARQP